MTFKIISPHLDDAVLSLGQMMAAPENQIEVVVTVFAGLPSAGDVSDYDRARGWESSREAVLARREEDATALAMLGTRATHYGFFDGQYRPTRPREECDLIVAALAKVFDEDTHVLAPLGLSHPDHRFVSNATLSACQWGTMMFYEDLPYRVTAHPREIMARFDVIRYAGFSVDALPVPLPVGDLAAKQAAIACYASEFPDGASDPCLLVPERVWRVSR